MVKPIIEKIAKTGKFEEASIGIYAYDKEVIQYLKENLKFESGIYVVKVNKNGAAYGTGILTGDIITKINNITLNKMSDLRKYIYTKEVGEEVTLTVNRKGKIFDVRIKLGNKQ